MEQLRIAVCDDETADLSSVIRLLQGYDKGQFFKILPYLQASELLAVASATSIDIALMDIEMPPPSGFDVAKELIKLSHPPVIIFTTKSNVYAMRGYGIAIRYLQKPLEEEAFREAMDTAVSEAQANRLVIQVESAVHAIRLADIRYIEIIGHYAYIYSGGKEPVKIRRTLNELLATLPASRFASPHKSYIVNFEHIVRATPKAIALDNGIMVPVGRKKSTEFSRAFSAFLGR